MNDNTIFKELKEVLIQNNYSQNDINAIEIAFEYSNKKPPTKQSLQTRKIETKTYIFS